MSRLVHRIIETWNVHQWNFLLNVLFPFLSRCTEEQEAGENGTFSLHFGTTESDDNNASTRDKGLDVYAFLTPFIILIGLFGNVISLCIFRKKALRRLSASFYLRAICISDICVLLTYVLLGWLNKGLPQWPGKHRYWSHRGSLFYKCNFTQNSRLS